MTPNTFKTGTIDFAHRWTNKCKSICSKPVKRIISDLFWRENEFFGGGGGGRWRVRLLWEEGGGGAGSEGQTSELQSPMAIL